MTQAPTPGPLSGDDVKPGHVYVEVSGLTGTGKSAVMGEIEIALKALSLTVEHGTDFQAEKNGTHADWQEALDLYKPVVVLRERNVSRLTLAPTAPVEASGSERDALHPDAQPFMHYPDLALHIERMAMSGVVGSGISWDAFLHELNKALRPQPSGETREAVRLALEDADALDRVSEEADDNQWQDWAATMRQAASRIRRLSLLSARPLALGGQQGVGEADRKAAEWPSCVACEDKPAPGSNPCAVCGLTTPARAEAQDEGAAGEASAYRVRMISNDPAEWVLMHPEKALDFLSRKGWESQPLYAHPSPTPAADEDRVREVAVIIRDRLRQIWDGDTHLVYSGNPPEPSHDEEGPLAKLANEAVEALNSVFPVPDALKSTAAKEGGSK